MSRRQVNPSSAAAWALGFALAGPVVAFGQVDPGQANLSTGSGAGTSPGVSPGSSPSSTNIGRNSLLGPRMDDQRPMRLPDALLPPGPVDLNDIEAIDAQLLGQARLVTDPNERALALERIARSKILAASNLEVRLKEAHAILDEAGESAMLAPPSTVRDLRLRQIALAHLLLAEEEIRQGLSTGEPGALDAPLTDSPKPREYKERAPWFDRALADYHRGAFVASRIENVNYQSDLLYRLTESETGDSGSQSIVNTAGQADSTRKDLKGQSAELYRVADRALVQSVAIARTIKLNIWRDRALMRIVWGASAAEQYARAAEIARLIPQPEYRTEALIRLAEAQARRNWSSDATANYAEAARAVASIPQADPRTIQANVLIDSLISVGRFDDARASIVFYPDDERKLAALGAIAMSQGERGLASKARGWIEREVHPDWQSVLQRKVDDGLIAAIERRRSRAMPFGSPTLPGVEAP